MNNPEPIAYNVNDACRVLGIGRTILYAEMKAGRLPAVKVGRRTLIRRADAEAWLQSHMAVHGG